MERLAKALFIIHQHEPDFDPAVLSRANPETARSIILNVFASSEIEGEGISAEYVEAFVAAVTEPGEQVSGELKQRMDSHDDIIATYFWGLNLETQPVISYDFVLEAHRRMFHRARSEIAGQIKDREVRIKWVRPDKQIVHVPTVEPERAETFLRALCERANAQFRAAERFADASTLLAAGEFACDFLAIHPFRDGNGRMARFLSSYLLERGGYHFSSVYPLDRVVLDSRGAYYEALNASQRHWHTKDEDLSSWIEYFVGVVFGQWERAFSIVRDRAAKKGSTSPKSFANRDRSPGA